MRSLIRCIVIAIAGFSLVVGMRLASQYVMVYTMTLGEILTWEDHWLAIAIPFVIAGVFCGGGAFFIGAPRSELSVGAVSGGAGLLRSWELYYPSLPSVLAWLVLGIVVFGLSELAGFKLAARIQRRGAATDV